MTTQSLKKLVLVSSIFLLAAGCNSAQPATPTGTQTTTSQQSTGGKTYTMADVQSASTPEKCWSAINGQVYDLTAWINKHPGGDKNILKICGIDGSSAFNAKHGGQAKPEETLKGFAIGVLK